MSDPDGLVPQNEASLFIQLGEQETEDGQQNLGNGEGIEEPHNQCVLHGSPQRMQEEEAERPIVSSHLNGEDLQNSTNSQAGHEDLALHWDGKEDLDLQQWSDGSSYRGNLTMNMKLGVGEFTWANGESYIGEFYKDHHHGRGVYSWPDGSKFTGSFYLSRKEGYGTMTFTDGRKYQGLYKSDVRFGPGFETYSDGSQDVGIWMGHHLFRLCTPLPGSVSLSSYPQFSQLQQPNQRSGSHDLVTEIEERKAEDPFLYRYKILLLEDKFTLPEKIYAYSSDTDHLPITPTQYLDFDQHFYRKKDGQQEKSDEVQIDNVQPDSGMRTIYLHVNNHRNSPEHLKWNINAILNDDRVKFGPKGPREWEAEKMIVASGLGDVESISAILRHDMAHVDVSDRCGLTALHAAAVNGHNNVINLLLDNGADVNKSNDEELSALSLCLMLFYSSKPFWPNVAERNLPLIKEESNDNTMGMRRIEGSDDDEKDERQKDTRPTVSDVCLQTLNHLTGPELETCALDSSYVPHRDKNLRCTINLLLLRGADPNLCTIPMHPLFFAVKAADVDAVQLLLECGSCTDVRLSTQYGSLTPLHIAAALPVAQGIRITEMLLCAVCDPSASAEDDDYVYDPDRGEHPGPVQGFPMKGCLDSGLPLYNYCEKSPLVPEEGGRTPLHVACEREDNYKLSKDTVSLLIAHNAQLNTVWSGHSPLSLAIASGNDLAVKELLANGADPNLALSRRVGSALCAAVSIVYEKQRTLPARIALVDRLIKSGANILMPILIGEGKKTALGTATDYAYYKYFQDKKIAHTPYHALSPEEKDIYNARKLLLEHLGKLTREAVTAKEREWAKDGIVRSSAVHRGKGPRVSPHITRGEACVSLTQKTFFKYCYQCGRSVGVKLTTCSRCHRIHMCSRQCKKSSWVKLHKDECSGKLSGKIPSTGGERSSPTKSLDATTIENYSYN